MDQKLSKAAQEALAQAKSEGLSDEDAKWMAVGAVNRKAREVGIVGEELSPEMNAAAQAVVKEVKRGKGA